jgi:hypothetical protein
MGIPPGRASAPAASATWWSTRPGSASRSRTTTATSLAPRCAHRVFARGPRLRRRAGNGRRHRARLPLLDEVFWIVAGDVYMPGFLFTRAAVRPFAPAASWPTCSWCRTRAQPEGRLRPVARRPGAEQAPSALHLFHRRPVPQGAVRQPARRQPAGRRSRWRPAARRDGPRRGERGALHRPWTDVGTPERLGQLNRLNQPQTRRIAS